MPEARISDFDENGTGTVTYYYANYTTKTYNYVQSEVVSVESGVFDNKDGRFDMRDWKHRFSVNIGSVDALALPYIVVDFGGTEKEFDEGILYFNMPATSRDIPFTLNSNLNKWQMVMLSDTYTYDPDVEDDVYVGYIQYNSALYGEAAEVLYLDRGNDSNAEYYVSLPAQIMEGADKDPYVTDQDTGEEVSNAELKGNKLVLKGGATSGDLTIKANGSDNRNHECDLELLVVPEEIPVVGKVGAKKYSEMLKKAQQSRVTKISDVIPYSVSTSLFGMPFSLSNMGVILTIDWTKCEMELKFQGKLEWTVTKDSAGKPVALTIDLSGDKYISVIDKKGKYDWNLVGELKVSDFKIGRFEFSNLSLTVNKGSRSFSASAYIKLPWIKYSFGGSIGIVDGYLDSMSIGVAGLNVPLGNSGLFLQSISGGVKGIATALNLTFDGTLGLTAGPSFKVEFVDWLGIASGTYSLCDITVTGSLSTDGNLKGESTVSVLGGFVTGSGSAGIEGGELFATGKYTMLNGCISVEGEMRASTSGVKFSGKGTVTVPQSKIFGPLAGMSMSNNVSALITKSTASSYVMTWQEVSLFGNKFSLGFKCTLDGSVSLLGSNDFLSTKSSGLKSSSIKSLAAAPLTVRGTTAAPDASEIYTVSEYGTTLFQFIFNNSDVSVSLSNSGNEYTQAAIASGLYENMQIVSELSGENGVTIAVSNAAPGEWTLNAYGDADATFGSYTIAEIALSPAITAVTLNEDGRGAAISYTLGDISALENATVSISCVLESASGTESLLAEFAASEATGVYQYVMADDAPGGDYSFRITVGSDNYAPASAVSASCAFRTLDVEAPDQIQQVAAQWSSAGSRLSWAAPYDDVAVAGYKVNFRADADAEWSEADVTTPEFTFSGVPNGVYTFRVAAYDAEGNLGEWSDEGSILVNLAANAKYRNTAITSGETLELAAYEGAYGIDATGATVTAEQDSLISESALGRATIGGMVENSVIDGETTLLSGAAGQNLTVNGKLIIDGSAPEPEPFAEESVEIVAGVSVRVGTVTVNDGGTLIVGRNAAADDVTVGNGGAVALMADAEISGLVLDYGATLTITSGDKYNLAGDIRTAGRLNTSRFVAGNGYKIRFEQYKQTAEYQSVEPDLVEDSTAFMNDVDKLAGDVLEIEIDSAVYGSFKIADNVKYFNDTITVFDHADGSSAAVGFDGYMPVGNAICALTRNGDALYLSVERSTIPTPTVTVRYAEDDQYSYLDFDSSTGDYSSVVRRTTFRYSLNADMSDAVTITAEDNWESVWLNKADLVENATYYVQSSVEDAHGAKSAWSAPVAFTVVPKALPDAPTGLSVSNAANPNSDDITFKVDRNSDYNVNGYRFRYSLNADMSDAVTVVSEGRYGYSASVSKSEIVDGADYYLQAGVLIGSEWSYWSSPVTFNTQGWEYDGITIGPNGDYNYFQLEGCSARNVTVTEGGYFYGGGKIDHLTVNGGFFRDYGAVVTNATVNDGSYWLESGSVTDIVVNGGTLLLMGGLLNGADIGVDGVMALNNSYQPTVTGTILIQGNMAVSSNHPGLTTDASFIFDLGAHEADKTRMFIDYTSPLLGSRTFTVKLDDSPELGSYRICYTPDSGEMSIRLAAADNSEPGILSIGGESVNYDGLYYSLSSQNQAVYLHVSDNNDEPTFVGGVKLFRNGKVYAAADYYSDLAVAAGGECDYVLVEDGGELYSVTVGDGGAIDVRGMVSGAMIENGGTLTLRAGGRLLYSPITVYAGGDVTVEGGKVGTGADFNLVGGTLTLKGELLGDEQDQQWISGGHLFNFMLRRLDAPTTEAMISDYTMLQCDPEFTVMVSEAQAPGEYRLIGNAAGFTGRLSVILDGDGEPEYLYAGDKCEVGGQSYALSINDSILTLSVSGGTSPDAPAVKASTTKATNQDITLTATFSSDAATKQYSLDNRTWETYSGALTVSANGTYYFRSIDAAGGISGVTSYTVSNIDKVAPVKPTASADVTSPTNGNVTVTATFSSDAATKQYSLDNRTWQTYKDGVVMTNNGTVYFRALDEAGNVSEVASFTVANIERAPLEFGGSVGFDGVYQESRNAELEHSGWYTISGDFGNLNGNIAVVSGKKTVASGTLKNGELKFNNGKNVLLDGANDYTIVVKNTDKGKTASEYKFTLEAVSLFTDGNNDDDWADMKTAGAAGKVADLGKVTAGSTELLADWVGFGDAADYMAFTLDSAAKLSFDVTATDAAKFTIYALADKTNKGITTYSLKTLQGAGLAKSKGAAEYTATTKDLLLEAGTYYIGVQSTNAAKGGNADYTVALSSNSVFYTQGDNTDDNWTAAATWDGDEEIADWVGFGDKIDYRKLAIDANGGFYDFELFGVENNVKLTVYAVNAKTNKKGDVAYSLKTVKSVTATAKKPEVSTGNLCFDGDKQYVLAVEAPGANRARNSDYTIRMTATATFANLGNETWDYATVLAEDLDGMLTTAAGGDRYDYFDLSNVDALSIDMTAGKVKASFFDENRKAVKASAEYANGKSAMLASVMLVADNAATDTVTFGALDDSIRYLKLEAAAAGVNTYSLSLIA